MLARRAGARQERVFDAVKIGNGLKAENEELRLRPSIVYFHVTLVLRSLEILSERTHPNPSRSEALRERIDLARKDFAREDGIRD